MKFCPNCAYALNGNSAVVSEPKYTTQPQYIDPQQEYLQPNQQIYRGKKQPIMPLGDHVEQNFVAQVKYKRKCTETQKAALAKARETRKANLEVKRNQKKIDEEEFQALKKEKEELEAAQQEDKIYAPQRQGTQGTQGQPRYQQPVQQQPGRFKLT